MKKLLHLLLMLSLAIGAYAQTSVKGKVVDARTGEPLIGASVLLKSNPGIGTTGQPHQILALSRSWIK